MSERGISTRQLARQVPCDPGYVSKLAAGVKHPSRATAARLDDVLDAGGRLERSLRPQDRTRSDGAAVASAEPGASRRAAGPYAGSMACPGENGQSARAAVRAIGSKGPPGDCRRHLAFRRAAESGPGCSASARDTPNQPPGCTRTLATWTPAALGRALHGVGGRGGRPPHDGLVPVPPQLPGHRRRRRHAGHRPGRRGPPRCQQPAAPDGCSHPPAGSPGPRPR